MRNVIIYIPMFATITEDAFQSGVAEIDFDGRGLVQIQLIDDIWEVTNAMNGYGENNRHNYIGSKVEIK